MMINYSIQYDITNDESAFALRNYVTKGLGLDLVEDDIGRFSFVVCDPLEDDEEQEFRDLVFECALVGCKITIN